MLLQGNKDEGTDLHSKTAMDAGCSRDQAKVLNYSRIYGSGIKLAKQTLMEFDPKLTHPEAQANADRMFQKTKGVRRSVPVTNENHDDEDAALYESLGLSKKKQEWYGGTESHMFNKLE